MKTSLTMTDHGDPLLLTLDGCTQYHGRDSIGGMTLGFGLVAFAVGRLAAINGQPVAREDVEFETAFPGPGVRDAVEFTTRAVSRKKWITVDPDTVSSAPEAVYGRLWFALSTPTHRVVMQLKPGVLSDDFIQTGRRMKTQASSPELASHWRQVKDELAVALEASDIEGLLDWSIEVR